VNAETKLRRLRGLTGLVILGLVLSGVTAIPLEAEVRGLIRWTGAREILAQSGSPGTPAWAAWLVRIQTALQ